MKLRELISEGVIDSFKAGYKAPLVGKGALGGIGSSGSSSASAATKKTAIDHVDPQELKQIIDAVLSGQKLNDRQTIVLQSISKKL